MLKQRVITAVVLLALLIPALLAPVRWPFAVLTLLMIAAAGWEWARLNGAAGRSVGVGVLVAALCAAALAAGWDRSAPAWLWWTAAALWIVGGPLLLRAGPSAWPRAPVPARHILGVGVLFAAWAAIAAARTIGLNFILSIFCLVWAADIFAYFGGRAFGRRKLAPTISPGKSWEGAVSGLAGVLVLAAAWPVIDTSLTVDSPSIYTHLHARGGWVGLVLGVVLLVAMSVVGDLFESLVKRSAGAKDSSNLLPGHGGVLDRIDALLPVFPIALALRSF
ncbi:MAG: phosphatidate cytidylyltransferase [Proteobacteria bacterium]|nr:phosphatidate cytidylyltransferase [Pseudomonadota bacterium]